MPKAKAKTMNRGAYITRQSVRNYCRKNDKPKVVPSYVLSLSPEGAYRNGWQDCSIDTRNFIAGSTKRSGQRKGGLGRK